MKILSALLLISLSFSLSAQDDTTDYSDAFRLIDVWIDSEKDFRKLPGISIAVVDDQEVLYAKGFGYSNPDVKLQADENTTYSICSISKLFTSIAIMQLRDQGKLSLESHISDLLPWYNLKQGYDESGPITIRNLLTHSSGLPRESHHPYWSEPAFDFPTADEVRSGLKNQESLYPSSTYFQYSNLGMTLLGEVIKELTGMSYEDYIKQNILAPLSLNDTDTELPEEAWGRQLSKGYSAIKRDGTRDLIQKFDAEGITAAAGLSSSVGDLAKFASWNFETLDKSNAVLKSSTLKEMQNVHYMDPSWDLTWGLGFSVFQSDGDKVVGHGGSCPGYRSQIFMKPDEKTATVTMINAMENPSKYNRAIDAIISKAKNANMMQDSIDMMQYAGIYNAQPWGSESLVIPWYGQLAEIYLPSQNPANNMTMWKHIEGDTFRRVRDNEELGETVIFERDTTGKVIQVIQHDNYMIRLQELEVKP